ncbi:MAG TPA: hypothetical protein EYG85_01495 [Crocinitomix sp.]|nr:hypothetical protein [Crocinitomix sp.]
MSIDIKRELKNPINQQYIAEILFPFIGYLFFDWSLLIIVVFYLLDQLASQILFAKRLHTINKYWNENKGQRYLLASLVLFFLIFFVELFVLNQSFSKISDLTGICYNDELIEFSKNELWFLFPLLLAMYYLQDKMLFYLPKLYEQHLTQPYFIKNGVENLIILILVSLSTYIYFLFSIPDMVVILCIVVVKLIFDLVIKKRLDILINGMRL